MLALTTLSCRSHGTGTESDAARQIPDDLRRADWPTAPGRPQCGSTASGATPNRSAYRRSLSPRSHAALTSDDARASPAAEPEPDTLPCQGRKGGSDGDHSREYKLPDTHFAVTIPVILVRPAQQQPQIDPALWAEIAERARYASLRDLAVEYGVSHETIRAVVRRVAAPPRANRIA